MGGADVPSSATRQALPTVTGFAVKCAIAALRRGNIAAGPLLNRAGLSERDFDNPQRRVSAAAQGEFLENAAEALSDSAFGLHLAERANPREAGLLFYVASAAENLGEALTLFVRYFRIVNESVHLNLRRRPDGMIVEANYFGIGRHLVRQNTEFLFAVVVKAIREGTGRDVCPTRVACAHKRTSDLREFERFYRCAVEFGMPLDQLAFSNETLALPLLTQDPHLLETLRPFCDAAARARNTATGSIRASVENEVQRLLPHGRAQAETIAKALAVSPRTLSRRLVEEGTTYAEVIDQLRRSLATQYLREPGFTLAQIGWLLGYEGPTSFNHAFKRWTGRSPSTARNQARLPRSEYPRAQQT
jgi:AraC-like DNA-binding protein